MTQAEALDRPRVGGATMEVVKPASKQKALLEKLEQNTVALLDARKKEIQEIEEMLEAIRLSRKLLGH